MTTGHAKIDTIFTSLGPVGAARCRLLGLIDEASDLAASHQVDLHVMAFAFTDTAIADALAAAASRHPRLTVRILADWSQRIVARGQQVNRLSSLSLPNLRIRYHKDQPYVWDPAASHMRWSYHASRGLLHHKTLAVLINGRPWRLICGSSNWTTAASRSYENLLIFNADDPQSTELMARIELEFESLWSDGRMSLSPREAHLHYQAILERYRLDPTSLPSEVDGITQGNGDALKALDFKYHPRKNAVDLQHRDELQPNPEVTVAFSFRDPLRTRAQGGCADDNQTQRFILTTPSATVKRAPLTITNLALDTIFRAVSGDTLKMAMYAISTRVPEYGALLDAARRGVRVRLILDRAVGSDVSACFKRVGQTEGLPIDVRTARKTMHQKYLIHLQTSTVLTGTANMSTDASTRHLEHRIRVTGNAPLTAEFNGDFDRIWARLNGDATTSSAKPTSGGGGRKREVKPSTNSENPPGRASR